MTCPRCGEASCSDPDSKAWSDNCIGRLQRQLALAQTEIKGHMRVQDELKERISGLEEMLSMACAVAEAGFDTDYGFNYEASIEPRRIIGNIRAALKSRA